MRIPLFCLHRISDKWRCPGVQVCCELRGVEVTPATEPQPQGSTEPPPPPPPPPPGSCGVRGATGLRILNDDSATEFGEFPWMLALFSGEDTEDGNTQYSQLRCGASLIHPQVAITAAHCVSRYFLHVLRPFLSSFVLYLFVPFK